MSIFDGFADEIAAMQDEIRGELGTRFKILSSDARNGVIEKAFVRDLALNDFPLIRPENRKNAMELNPRVLDLLPIDTKLQDLDFIVIPATSDDKQFRYRASNVQEVLFQDIIVNYFALIYITPDLS